MLPRYSHPDWNLQQGTIPVFWQKHHYSDAEWHDHPNTSLGFTTDHDNLTIYGDRVNVLVPGRIDPIFESALDYFDLHRPVLSLSKYEPGMILPWHEDLYATYRRLNGEPPIEHVVRIMVFLEPSQPGHQLWIGDRLCQGPAGQWHSWQGAQRHMACNVGETPRYVIQITGTATAPPL